MITTNKNKEKYIGILLQYEEDESKRNSVINNTVALKNAGNNKIVVLGVSHPTKYKKYR